MGQNVILETERLFLREMTQDDFPSLCNILQDEETMYAYEGAFTDSEAQEWLDRQRARYQKWGFGLWAVILKDNGKMIGQCGLTMQPWKEEEVLDIAGKGRLLHRPGHQYGVPACGSQKRDDHRGYLDEAL